MVTSSLGLFNRLVEEHTSDRSPPLSTDQLNKESRSAAALQSLLQLTSPRLEASQPIGGDTLSR
jgi:hypothetical protein